MKKVTACIIGMVVICLSLLLMPAAGSAADSYMGYMVFKGGYYGPGEDFDKEDFEGNDYWELALGTDLGMLGLELSGGYMRTENNFIDVKTIPVLLTGRLQFPITMFYPYIEAGAGAYFIDMDPKGLESKSETEFGYHTGLGCDVRFKRLILGVEGRYIWVNSDYKGMDVDLQGFTVTGNIGFRF